LLAAGPSAFAQFEQANREFAAGDFKSAIAHYEELVQKREYSASLFYNLANAYFRAHDPGHAILNYERALALEPHHPEAEANLRVARDEARALELPRESYSRFLKFLDPSHESIVAAVAFWLGLFALAHVVFSRTRRRLALATAILSLAVGVGAAFAVYRAENVARTLAVVTGSDVRARVATADSASSVLTLPPGSDVKLLRARGDWVYASLPNDLLGWVPAKNVELVRLN
jgi:tetratricopeptide (TPR) repeat protein